MKKNNEKRTQKDFDGWYKSLKVSGLAIKSINTDFGAPLYKVLYFNKELKSDVDSELLLKMARGSKVKPLLEKLFDDGYMLTCEVRITDPINQGKVKTLKESFERGIAQEAENKLLKLREELEKINWGIKK